MATFGITFINIFQGVLSFLETSFFILIIWAIFSGFKSWRSGGGKIPSSEDDKKWQDIIDRLEKQNKDLADKLQVYERKIKELEDLIKKLQEGGGTPEENEELRKLIEELKAELELTRRELYYKIFELTQDMQSERERMQQEMQEALASLEEKLRDAIAQSNTSLQEELQKQKNALRKLQAVYKKALYDAIGELTRKGKAYVDAQEERIKKLLEQKSEEQQAAVRALDDKVKQLKNEYEAHKTKMDEELEKIRTQLREILDKIKQDPDPIPPPEPNPSDDPDTINKEEDLLNKINIILHKIGELGKYWRTLPEKLNAVQKQLEKIPEDNPSRMDGRYQSWKEELEELEQQIGPVLETYEHVQLTQRNIIEQDLLPKITSFLEAQDIDSAEELIIQARTHYGEIIDHQEGLVMIRRAITALSYHIKKALNEKKKEDPKKVKIDKRKFKEFVRSSQEVNKLEGKSLSQIIKRVELWRKLVKKFSEKAKETEGADSTVGWLNQDALYTCFAIFKQAQVLVDRYGKEISRFDVREGSVDERERSSFYADRDSSAALFKQFLQEGSNSLKERLQLVFEFSKLDDAAKKTLREQHEFLTTLTWSALVEEIETKALELADKILEWLEEYEKFLEEKNKQEEKLTEELRSTALVVLEDPLETVIKNTEFFKTLPRIIKQIFLLRSQGSLLLPEGPSDILLLPPGKTKEIIKQSNNLLKPANTEEAVRTWVSKRKAKQLRAFIDVATSVGLQLGMLERQILLLPEARLDKNALVTRKEEVERVFSPQLIANTRTALEQIVSQIQGGLLAENTIHGIIHMETQLQRVLELIATSPLYGEEAREEAQQMFSASKRSLARLQNEQDPQQRIVILLDIVESLPVTLLWIETIQISIILLYAMEVHRLEHQEVKQLGEGKEVSSDDEKHPPSPLEQLVQPPEEGVAEVLVGPKEFVSFANDILPKLREMQKASFVFDDTSKASLVEWAILVDAFLQTKSPKGQPLFRNLGNAYGLYEAIRKGLQNVANGGTIQNFNNLAKYLFTVITKMLNGYQGADHIGMSNIGPALQKKLRGNPMDVIERARSMRFRNGKFD
ncbi:MAG: hypothetical protein H6502_03645 [Candidatus Woesearchaeota archaeon]|nr:MAG: hypothetical protein H6502_03645 [Candidatus Woesearchaeota archaeon]